MEHGNAFFDVLYLVDQCLSRPKLDRENVVARQRLRQTNRFFRENLQQFNPLKLSMLKRFEKTHSSSMKKWKTIDTVSHHKLHASPIYVIISQHYPQVLCNAFHIKNIVGNVPCSLCDRLNNRGVWLWRTILVMIIILCITAIFWGMFTGIFEFCRFGVYTFVGWIWFVGSGCFEVAVVVAVLEIWDNYKSIRWRARSTLYTMYMIQYMNIAPL